MAALWMADAIATLFVGRRTWSPPDMRGARVWQASLADHLHADALLEDGARRGKPRTARECSEREWLLQALDRDVLDANRAAWEHHRATAPSPRTRTTTRRRSLASYYADAIRADREGTPA